MKLRLLDKRWEQDSGSDDAYGQGRDWLAGTSSKAEISYTIHALLGTGFAHFYNKTSHDDWNLESTHLLAMYLDLKFLFFSGLWVHSRLLNGPDQLMMQRGDYVQPTWVA